MKNLDYTPLSNNSNGVPEKIPSLIVTDSGKALTHFGDLAQKSITNTTSDDSYLNRLTCEEFTEFFDNLSIYARESSKERIDKSSNTPESI